jgi:hypothetical protein
MHYPPIGGRYPLHPVYNLRAVLSMFCFKIKSPHLQHFIINKYLAYKTFTMRFNLTKLFIGLLLSNLVLSTQGQSISYSNNIHLPDDTTVRSQLVHSLSGFLKQKEKPNKDNTYVLNENLLATSGLLDEMKGIDQNAALKDPNFYKASIINCVDDGNETLILQIAYMGIKEGQPVLRSSFKLLAQKQGDKFYFSSPLKVYTHNWRSKKKGFLTFYYKDTLNTADADAYYKKVQFYNKKLKAPEELTDIYYCDNFTEAQQILGVDYKLDYNGIPNNILTSHENNKNLMLNAWTSVNHRFDPHDLWHERLRAVVSSDIINRPVDEGCAYLYGGSWGFSWSELQVKFKAYVAEHPDADWLKLYLDATNFSPGPKILKVSYMLNALIVRKIETEEGFPAVIQLLSCGKKEPGDENYFKALDQIIGINKGNFNVKVGELVKGM